MIYFWFNIFLGEKILVGIVFSGLIFTFCNALCLYCRCSSIYLCDLCSKLKPVESKLLSSGFLCTSFGHTTKGNQTTLISFWWPNKETLIPWTLHCSFLDLRGKESHSITPLKKIKIVWRTNYIWILSVFIWTSENAWEGTLIVIHFLF